MSSPKFVSAGAINTKFAERNRIKMDASIEAVNKVVNEAQSFPISVPAELFTDIESVRLELLRQLREMYGWKVLPHPMPTNETDKITHYLLRP